MLTSSNNGMRETKEGSGVVRKKGGNETSGKRRRAEGGCNVKKRKLVITEVVRERAGP